MKKSLWLSLNFKSVKFAESGKEKNWNPDIKTFEICRTSGTGKSLSSKFGIINACTETNDTPAESP